MSNRAMLTVLLVGLTSGLTGCANSWRRAAFERDFEVALPPCSGIDARTSNGSVRLDQTDRPDVLVRAHVRATTQARADAVQIVGTETGGWLEISALWPDSSRMANEGVSFVVEAPGGQPVRVDTRNGAVTVTGFAGGAELNTANGAITVNDHDGPIEAATSNGRIDITGATAEVAADTNNGAVRVELANEGTGPVRIDTSNGSVTLVVGPGFAGRIDAGTSNGSVRLLGGPVASVSGSRADKTIQIGEGGHTSRVETSNGSVEVEVRR